MRVKQILKQKQTCCHYNILSSKYIVVGFNANWSSWMYSDHIFIILKCSTKFDKLCLKKEVILLYCHTWQ